MAHDEPLTLLLNRVGAVEGLELLLQVLEQVFLLLLRQAFILVAVLDLLLAFLDSGTKGCCVFIKFLLLLLLVSEHVIIVSERVLDLILVLVLHGLLLKLDVSEAALLLLLLLAFVLFERLLVSESLTIDQGLVAN